VKSREAVSLPKITLSNIGFPGLGPFPPVCVTMLSISNIVARTVLSGPLAGPCLSQLLHRGFASQPAPADEQKVPQLPPFNYLPQPYTGPSKEEVLLLRKKFLSPCEQQWQLVSLSPQAVCPLAVRD
jgi:hypothetical protein